MSRITKKEVKTVFDSFREIMGHPEAIWEPVRNGLKPPPGAWELVHAPVYGGYIITEHLAEGGITYPFGYEHQQPKAFVNACRMASTAAYMMKKQLEA